MGLSNDLCCEAGSFSHCHLNPPRCPQPEVLRLYFPVLEPWVVQSDSLPSCSSQFIFMQMWYHRVLQPPFCHESSPPSCPSLPLLPVWMNVSSLSPCQTSRQFDFLSVLVVFCFKIVVFFLLVVRGGTVCLPTPPSWLEA